MNFYGIFGFLELVEKSQALPRTIRLDTHAGHKNLHSVGVNEILSIGFGLSKEPNSEIRVY